MPRIHRQEKATRLHERIMTLALSACSVQLQSCLFQRLSTSSSAEVSSQVGKYSGSDMKPLRHLKRRPPAALPAAESAAYVGCACSCSRSEESWKLPLRSGPAFGRGPVRVTVGPGP